MDCQFDRESLGFYPESRNFNDKCLFIQEDCWELWEKENRQSPKENEDPFLKKQGKFQNFYREMLVTFLVISHEQGLNIVTDNSVVPKTRQRHRY